MSVWASWSCGKDGAFAVHETRRAGDDVVGLLTTTSDGAVAMSRVPPELLARQADALGLPCETVELPWPCPNEVYERRTAEGLARLRAAGATALVHGDLFLADVRAYRERALTGSGLTPRFPLWGRPTAALAQDMLAAGLRAVIVCVDPAQAPAELAGRAWDADLLAALPPGVDPCGENGEFHTFVTDGPGFAAPVDIVVGPPVARDGFVFSPLAAAGT